VPAQYIYHICASIQQSANWCLVFLPQNEHSNFSFRHTFMLVIENRAIFRNLSSKI
jgi:hypothetical protein